MDNQEQIIPQQIPIQPSELQQNISSNTSWLRILSIGFSLVSFCIAIGIGGYVLGTRKNQPASQSQNISTSPTIAQFPSPTPDPTANWKTYTGTGFTLKYPSEDLEYIDLTSANPSYQGLKNANCSGFQTTGARGDVLFSVCIAPDSVDKVLSDMKNYIVQAGGSLGQIISENKIEFNKYPATELVTENKTYKPSLKESCLITSKNSKTYVLCRLFINQEEELMLSFFKFIQ